MIVVSGIESSGSTAVWQMVSQLVGYKVKKNHGFHDPATATVIATIRDFRDVLASLWRRQAYGPRTDPDEYMRTCYSVIEKRFWQLRKYNVHSGALVVKYEDWFCGGEANLIYTLADWCGVPCPPDKLDAVIQYTSLSTNKARASKQTRHGNYHQDNRIHGNHVSANGEIGSYQETFKLLSPEVSQEIIGKLNEPLREFGYL